MYCNKCGNEIAENMKFCTRCGTRLQEPASICSKCGQTISGTMKFCTRCGEKIIRREEPYMPAERYVPTEYNSPASKDIPRAIIAFVGAGLMGILAIIYIIVASKYFDGNKDVFELLEDSYKTFGIVLHWGICAAVVSECFTCIIRVLSSENKGKYLIRTSVSMLMTAIIIWIGSMVWNDFELEEVSIVLYRIFATYEHVILGSFVLTIITLVFGILCANLEKNRKV